ncbi:Scytalone dehydratase [Pyrenochaeta sp. MPI-SDFR-AT-0127]|nr:Scytalone dehydratase [Pyrenochaeta sp. MPI-SDFR-AT-0127]
MGNDITFEEYLALSRITFEWADSYDSKQFDRLAAILGPSVTLDYSDAFGQKPITMTRAAFMKLSDNPNRLGGIVDCIHHIGGSKYDRTGPDSVTGFHQVRSSRLIKTSQNRQINTCMSQGGEYI